MSKVEIRKECRAYASRMDRHPARTNSSASASSATGSNPYLTMTDDYEAATARELARFAERGGLYKGKKPVHWCSSCVTALAEAEVEYADHTSHSIYVKFPYADTLPAELEALGRQAALLRHLDHHPLDHPRQPGVASIPELPYVAVEVGGEVLVDCRRAGARRSSPAGNRRSSDGRSPPSRRRSSRGKQCRHPFYDRPSLIVLGDYVTLEAGTGCVHTAPGHGHDDYLTGLRYGLEIYNPVDDYGRYRPDVELFGGMKITDANPRSSTSCRKSARCCKRGKITPQLSALLALQEADHLPRHRAVVHLHGGQRPARAGAAGDQRCRLDPALGARAHLRHDRQPPRLVRQPPAQLGGADHRLLLRRLRRGPGRRQDHAPCRRSLRKRRQRPLVREGGRANCCRPAPLCGKCGHGGFTKRKRHPRCLVRFRRLPCRRARAARQLSRPGRSLPGRLATSIAAGSIPACWPPSAPAASPPTRRS